MKKLLLAVAVFGLASSVAAKADPIGTTETFNLTVDTCGCGTGSTVFGTVTLDQIATGEVSVTETLNSGIHFVGTGAGQALVFSLNPSVGTLTYSGLNPVPPAAAEWSTLTDAKDKPFANGDYGVTCNNLACDDGDKHKFTGPLTFTLTSTNGVDISDFVPIDTCYEAKKNTPPCQTIYLSSDLLGPNGTGVIGALVGDTKYPTPPPASTPEPSSLALLGSGVLGLAGMVRRKFRRS
jgi:hypothetical protein